MIENQSVRIRIKDNLFFGAMEVFITQKIDNKLYVLSNGPDEEGLRWIEANIAQKYGPTFTINTEFAQILSEDLWECGIRARQGQGSIGQLQATHLHLEDMRKIVSNKLGVKL
jgi:hypothetical protein